MVLMTFMMKMAQAKAEMAQAKARKQPGRSLTSSPQSGINSPFFITLYWRSPESED